MDQLMAHKEVSLYRSSAAPLPFGAPLSAYLHFTRHGSLIRAGVLNLAALCIASSFNWLFSHFNPSGGSLPYGRDLSFIFPIKRDIP